jgi:hypothetical protein
MNNNRVDWRNLFCPFDSNISTISTIWITNKLEKNVVNDTEQRSKIKDEIYFKDFDLKFVQSFLSTFLSTVHNIKSVQYPALFSTNRPVKLYTRIFLIYPRVSASRNIGRSVGKTNALEYHAGHTNHRYIRLDFNFKPPTIKHFETRW